DARAAVMQWAQAGRPARRAVHARETREWRGPKPTRFPAGAGASRTPLHLPRPPRAAGGESERSRSAQRPRRFARFLHAVAGRLAELLAGGTHDVARAAPQLLHHLAAAAQQLVALIACATGALAQFLAGLARGRLHLALYGPQLADDCVRVIVLARAHQQSC